MLRIQNEILRMIADGEPLDDTARQICVLVEAELPGTICSILVVDRAGLLHPLAAPSLPDDYSDALDGMVIGPEVGACGTAAYLREVVIIEDMTVDPRCAKFASRIDGLGVTACWSLPILNDERNTVAVLGLYHRDRHYPGKAERELAEACVDLCAIALRRNERIADRERRANIDALTGLPNRSAFETAMANIPCDEIGSWGLFILDLDNLKVVNDTFGHLAGDALIRTAASRISHVMAPDITFRLGGDEFAVIMQSPELLSDLDAAAARIFAALELPAPCEGHMVVPRATIGGAVLAQGEATAIAVSEAADFALYHAKETGRGGFVRYWPGIGSRITRRRDAIRDVAGALKDDRIEAHYQPVVRLDTGEIIGLEALCRMRTVDGDLITAADFHEATTDAHVAAELTEQMLAAVAGDIRHWLDSGIPVQHVGINVSTADFYTGSIGKKLESAFDRAGVSLKHLVLEVSEDVYLGRRDRVVAKEIESLRAAGVLVALDDFGTGYASLTHLLSVPVDIIKIDQTFVARLWPEDPSMVIVEGLIDIARRLDIRVVAEGIETEVQASQLWSMGCHLGQGFAFARPGDRVTTERLLRRHAQGMGGTVPLYPVSLQAPASSNGSVPEQKLASPHRRASVG
ncbi:putative signal transduction protein [Sphingobium chlorophenolicum]|uniref:Putative signal transduction protein n=2 Tax=Sphingobium chlorophenolicum TaxID=46429 RepID=A0A081RAH4_SPHCR|nr:GGDEF domain-containing protein [Sphingobium chlorophenolicum]KEQ52197.1 putative signal transduction protein [Sphingobium chlorophenolicum]